MRIGTEVPPGGTLPTKSCCHLIAKRYSNVTHLWFMYTLADSWPHKSRTF